MNHLTTKTPVLVSASNMDFKGCGLNSCQLWGSGSIERNCRTLNQAGFIKFILYDFGCSVCAVTHTQGLKPTIIDAIVSDESTFALRPLAEMVISNALQELIEGEMSEQTASLATKANPFPHSDESSNYPDSGSYRSRRTSQMIG